MPAATYGSTPPPANASAALLSAWPTLSPAAQQALVNQPNAVLKDGNWFTPQGDFIVAGGGIGATPQQTGAQIGPVQTDASGKKFELVGGQKWYLPTPKPDSGGGGLVHGKLVWDPEKGEWTSNYDAGKILSMVAAGIITAGAADAILGSTAATASATSGLGSAPLPGAGTALTGPAVSAAGPTAAAGGGGTAAVYGPTAASTTSGEFVGPIAANGSNAYGPAAAGGGLSVTDALKYGLPTAGNIVGGLIQANASSNASDKQTAYLEQALAYEKEKDAYDRTTAANKVQLEANRYATYSGNTAPFIANGVTSGNRMTSLLGLPAGAPNAGGSLNGGGGSQGVPVSPEITTKVNDYYKSIGVTPTGPGTGPTDAAYYAGKDAETGGLTDANNAYWFGPNSRIGSDLAKAGVKTGTPTPAPAPTAGTPSPQATAAQQVTLKGPDGSVKAVPASQLKYWLGKGAQQVSA